MLLLLAFWAPALLTAQSFTASLQGVVQDTSGAMIPNAQVTLENEATNVRQTTTTNENGRYVLASLSPGSYRLSVETPGFQTSVRTGMVLQVQQQATVDIVMTPGEVNTSITISGEAPRLDATTATLGRVVENASVLSMPLGSRNTLDLAILTPGVSGSTGFTGTNFVSNGTRNSQSDVLIDGTTVAVQEQNGGVTDAKFRPSVEVVQEMKVMTNSFSAEYGNTGGTVVTMVTRSGTNQLHGSAFEFLRNSALNSNNFFANRSGREIVPFRRNQFGGALGGPVYIPRLYDGRDRTFFFFHYEATRQSSQHTALSTVPTALEKQGNFSDTRDSAGRLITIYDPSSVHTDPQTGKLVREPFPANIIPRSRMDPVALHSMQFYPEPNLPGNPFTRVNNFFNSGARTSNDYQTTAKIDHNFTQAQRFSARYSQYRITGRTPNLWGNWMNPYDDGPESPGDITRNASADYTNTISPTTILNLRWGLARQFGVRRPFCEQCPEFNIA
ncbi:MAG: carboxypeptidase regulatory-like domain-containing protein, partial [Bryobacteraceae bacterium]